MNTPMYNLNQSTLQADPNRAGEFAKTLVICDLIGKGFDVDRCLTVPGYDFRISGGKQRSWRVKALKVSRLQKSDSWSYHDPANDNYDVLALVSMFDGGPPHIGYYPRKDRPKSFSKEFYRGSLFGKDDTDVPVP